jgi:hypothetical protein
MVNKMTTQISPEIISSFIQGKSDKLTKTKHDQIL